MMQSYSAFIRDACEYTQRILDYSPKDDHEAFVYDHIKLLFFLLKRYGILTQAYAKNMDAADIIEEGIVSLLKAKRGYTTDKQCKFSTYFARILRNDMINYFTQKASLFRQRKSQKPPQMTLACDLPLRTSHNNNSNSPQPLENLVIRVERDVIEDEESKQTLEKKLQKCIERLPLESRMFLMLYNSHLQGYIKPRPLETMLVEKVRERYGTTTLTEGQIADLFGMRHRCVSLLKQKTLERLWRTTRNGRECA